MNALAARRRHPAAIALLLMLGLLLMGALYSAFKPSDVQAQTATLSAEDVQEGQKLYLSNCATCHGKNGVGTDAGPSLVGVGAAAVDFQVGTGRMPLAAPNVQAQRKEPQFDEEQTQQLAAYVASLGPGPAVPGEEYTENLEGADIGKGGEIFRVNCAMCHNATGQGGALTRGKYAPSLVGVENKHVYEAMVTGPQSMPVFSDDNLSPEDKRDVIAYLNSVHNQPKAGGNDLGNLGPVGDAVFIWTIGVLLFLGAAFWLARKAS